MSLLIIILILVVWAIVGAAEKVKPKNQPIKDMEKHLRMIMKVDNPVERRKLIKKYH